MAKTNDGLVSFIKNKAAVEHHVEGAFEGICKAKGKPHRRIHGDLEKKAIIDMRQRLKNVIAQLEREKKNTARNLDTYKRQLREKIRKFKKLSQEIK